MTDTAPRRLRWVAVDAPPPLTPTGLHLWRIPLHGTDPAADARALALLSPDQQQRLARLRRAEPRLRYLRTHAGCRRILARYLDLHPARIGFRYGAAGKPEITATERRLEFNLTNSGDLALLAVSAEEPVGIDCELERGRDNLLGIARRMFPPETHAALAALPPGATQLRHFHLHWTALEARVKADGRGLARHQEPDPIGLEVHHAMAGDSDGHPAICAVARRSLPPPGAWIALELAA
ncbi:4'-phosphopantetheinyl transferase superfamily protein [Thiohalocapsa marina]|uniref:4'-phosphopantetheinyl transferase superfamily protein n=1 Tax=Thiohalocapsa marina TaxID=424902 RepID=A0A5M8FB36_9GAMM|nr:4'-phosphopantetheinyl transferase superfamily protein [Thiohalocapsa marina]KAA6181889.1 4'-phosphopantetheinyl transferase superfamily protein [Thiohalocapsa marina]